MGRDATPNNLHHINGNPSKKNLAALSSGARVPVEIPKVPSHLNTIAKKEWRWITVELEKLGLISTVDKAAVAAYCCHYSRWVTAERKLKELGDDGLITTAASGYQVESPWVRMSDKSMTQMRIFLGAHGMTPNARKRVDVTPQMDLNFSNNGPGEDKNVTKYFGA